MITSDQANFEIKMLAKKQGIKLRDVAAECGMRPESLSRLLRFRLRKSEERQIKEAIEKLAENQGKRGRLHV